MLVMAGPARGMDEMPRSKVLPQVRVLWLDANACTQQLSSGLQGIGYALATAIENAEGVINVDLRYAPTEAGAAARYSATIRDRQGDIIRQTSGHGESMSRQELCSVISRRIVEYLDQRMGVIGQS
jgi:hypothetical protein